MIEPLIIIISLCVLTTEIYMQDWLSVILYFFILCLCHYVLKIELYVSFGIAGICASVLNLTKRLKHESFTEEDEEEDKDEDEEEDEEGDEEEEEEEEEILEDDDEEWEGDMSDMADRYGVTQKVSDAERTKGHPHTHTKDIITHDHIGGHNSLENDPEEGFTNSNPIDMNKTIKDALTNFDPKTLKNMTKDTAKLIKEQSELMKTISQMQPIIEKGMGMLDKFQGEGKTQELFEKFAKMQKLKKK